jgi:kynurenine formamidase
VAKRWARRPEGSTWGDWGEDDELGRINLITSEKVLEGVREVQAGKSFCLSLPLDFPGGSSLNQRRYPPIIRPTEDLAYKPDTFYNVVAKDSISPTYIDVWSDDMVTLWTQYSTQWDALVHQGALFDADGDGVDEPLYYNGFKPHVDIIGPKEDAKGDGSGSVAFARHLGLEHMAAHGVQGRAVLIDVAYHLNNTEEWTAVPMKTVREIMAADQVEVRPGDMVILHTGFTQKILDWDKNPDASRIQAMYPYLDGEDPEVLEWIADSQMSALIADNYAVEGWPAPNPEPHTLIPVHNLCLFKLGIPLGEMWYTQELATWLRANNRSSFLLTAPPLRLPGTAGGPLNPIATV